MTDPLGIPEEVPDVLERPASWWARFLAVWRQGPVKILAMLGVAAVVNFGVTGYALAKLQAEPRHNCEAIQDGVKTVRKLVTLVLVRAPADSTSQLVNDLRVAMAPGGDLEVPSCS